ncbi:MAG: hypothetical protein SWY16_02695 [Cyanobacteriota bacterium]|nr:hypothetical protein [Cyanobacteriota bacterium]
MSLKTHFHFKNAAITATVVLGLATAASLIFITAPQAETQPSPDVLAQFQDLNWRRMNATEEDAALDRILESPLGIAGLNQLAIEGFISPICDRSFYMNDTYGGLQFVLRIQCPNERGVSTAVGYDEMRIIYNQFESNIEDYEVERIGSETQPQIQLPD